LIIIDVYLITKLLSATNN